MTSIDQQAFYGCTALTSVNLPQDLERISDYSFEDCSALTDVSIPDGIVSIGYGAFRNCTSLTEITIPKSVTFIDYGAFRECASLSKIVFERDVPGYLFSVFMGVTATAYYPSNNSTWADVETLPHSGNITWVSYEVEENAVRIFGSNRYNTALAAADQLKENLGVEKFENIVVACGTDFADALSGSYLANQKNAPILLVKNRNKEINLVKDYIKSNLTPGGTVYLLGGVNAVPKAMESGLEGFNVKRLAGATRYETNLEILKEAGISGNDILVCTGLDFADGLSASAVNKPILLVKDSLRATQVNYLKTLGSKNFYLIGGTNAVNKRIESALAAYGTTQRIEDATRYYTSVNIAKTFFPNAKTAVLAYAYNFPDGLSGGCLACSMNAPLILTANGKQDPAVAYAKEAGITGGAVLGGTGLIPDKVANAIFQIS